MLMKAVLVPVVAVEVEKVEMWGKAQMMPCPDNCSNLLTAPTLATGRQGKRMAVAVVVTAVTYTNGALRRH